MKEILCKKCGKILKRRITKGANTMYLYMYYCRSCRWMFTGKRVPEQKLNPYYYSRSSRYSNMKTFLKKIGMTYKEYLLSEHWWELKIKYKENCFVCGNQNTDLHHRTYKNMGNEKKSDLISLCRKHHYEGVHTNNGMKRKMKRKFATDSVDKLPCA